VINSHNRSYILTQIIVILVWQSQCPNWTWTGRDDGNERGNQAVPNKHRCQGGRGSCSAEEWMLRFRYLRGMVSRAVDRRRIPIGQTVRWRSIDNRFSFAIRVHSGNRKASLWSDSLFVCLSYTQWLTRGSSDAASERFGPAVRGLKSSFEND